MRGKYRDVVLPMTVLRRLDAVLEPTKKAVLDMKSALDRADIANQDPALRQERCRVGRSYWTPNALNTASVGSASNTSKKSFPARFEEFTLAERPVETAESATP